MNSNRSSKVFWVFLILASVGLLAGVRVVATRSAAPVDVPVTAAATETTGTVSFLMEQQWLIQLKLAQVEEATLAPQIRSTGRVVPAPPNHAVVAPPVDGILTGGQLPRIGQDVRSGQVLALVTETLTAAESAQIRVEQARVEAERRRLAQARIEAEARLNFARSESERAGRLYEKKAYALRQVESAETDYMAAEAYLTGIEEQLNALSTQVEAATYQVRAPISGTVINVDKRAGERVGAGEAILEIVNMTTVWVEAPIFERDLGLLQPNPQATFSTPTFGDQEFRSTTVIDAGDVIDEDSRAAMFVFEVSNDTRLLQIGMQADLRLDTKESVMTMVIPKEAVLDNEGKKIVYVLLSGETFQRREVTLGDEYGEQVAILSGLEPGERVVTQGAYQLKLQELQPADAGEHSHEV